MSDQKIIESFHMMWDHFPVRVRLIQKNRTVLAVNKIAEAEGMTAGVRCTDVGGDHSGCLANAALKERRAARSLSADGEKMRYWVPVKGSEDVFVHFSIPLSDLLSPPKA